MALLMGIRERLKALFRRSEIERDMEEEFQFHLEKAIERNIERGMSPEEARRMALTDFGGVERTKEQTRDEQGVRLFIGTGQNFRYAYRYLRKSPGFTLIAILVMGLGVGATTAMFSVVNSLLFKRLYCKNPSEVIRIFTNDEEGRPRWNSYPDFLDFKKETDVFSAMGATSDIFPFSLVTEEGATTVLSDIFSSDVFPALGITPSLGRYFNPEEDVPGAADPVVMVNYDVWKDRHGGDPEIIGKAIKLNGYPVTIVGVGPPGFSGAFLGVITEYWVSWGTAALINAPYAYMEDRSNRECNIIARMKPGITFEQARTALENVAAGLAQEYPDTNADMSLTVLPNSDVRMDPVMDKVLFPLSGFLMTVVILVLLVACSNLAGFLLMRATSRQKEITVRVALGVGRGRLITQLLTENVLLGLAGGLLGIAIAYGIAGFASSYKPPLPFSLSIDFGVNVWVMLFAIVLALVTGILTGLIPAIHASKPDVVAALKDISPTLTMGRRRSTMRNIFIVSQITVSVVLLIGAALFIRSLGFRRNIDFGFESEHQAIAAIDVALGGYPDEQSARVFLENYRERILSQPGVETVAFTSRIPFGLFGGGSHMRVRLPDADPDEEEVEIPEVHYAAVSPEYFRAMGIPLLRGRTFMETGPGVQSRDVMVDEELAQHFWGNADAVGRSLLIGDDEEARFVTVVGVVANTKSVHVREDPQPFLYLPFADRYTMTTILVVKTSGNPAVLPELFRRELHALDSSVPVFDARTMEEHLSITFFIDRTAALFLSVFGALAMALASIGLYGTLAFSVALRTREVGIRVALGASSRQVIRLIIGQGMRLVITGIIIGCVIAGLATQVLARVLVGVSPLDPISFTVVALLLWSVAVLASYIPALRAARMNPMDTLHYE